MDSHGCSWDRRPGYDFDGKLILTEESRPAQIPWRSLLPQGVDNLIVPVCLSATHVAWGAVRLEPVWMMTGEAAGFAAALAKKEKLPPAKLDSDPLVRTLVTNKHFLTFFNELQEQANDPAMPAAQYFGTKGFFASYDAKLDEPLTERVKAAWDKGIAQLQNGTLEPMRLVRLVHEAEAVTSPLTDLHRGSGAGEEGTLQVLQSITRNGGYTWSAPTLVCDGTKLAGKHPCEPYVFRSPDGDELCCLMRENRRSGTSLVMFSRDEGKTWSSAVDAPWGLTGDRHHGITLPDGRLVIVFRNASPNSKDKGFIAWVGTYDDIKQGRPGQYRISLLKTFKDGFYPGLHLLPDGTIVATTYANYRKEDIGCSIVSVRFTMGEVDEMARASR